MQRVANYGSFMQAWALREMLRELGAEVSFIDIRSGRQLRGYEFHSARGYARRALELAGALFTGRLPHKLRARRYYREMRARFRSDYYALLGLDEPVPAHFDLAVIGSDQVFNPLSNNPWGFSTHLFGDVPEASQVISYAASFGDATISAMTGAGVVDEVATNLRRLTAISVRDDVSREIVSELTGREAELNFDPVLVHDFAPEIAGLRAPARDYIALYAYGGRFSDDEASEIVKFARARGKRIISLFSVYAWADECVIPGSPFEVLAWVRDADYVVTDTFHGAIFSIITRSNFICFTRPSNTMRIEPMMRRMGLESRLGRNVEQVLSAKPDYAQAEKAIAEERVRAKEYLRRWL